jgi:hypothetical protein
VNPGGGHVSEIVFDVVDRKFEPMVGGVKRLLVLFGDHVLARGRFENFQLLSFALLFAFFLELAQFGRIFLPAAMQACFLELQIAMAQSSNVLSASGLSVILCFSVSPSINSITM